MIVVLNGEMGAIFGKLNEETEEPTQPPVPAEPILCH
jgi:hypothetical protein